jgi:two-component sensor histidine kinase
VALGRPRPSGSWKPSADTGREYEVRAAPCPCRGRFVIHFRDLTELRRLEGEREAALEHAQRLLKELGHRVMNSFTAISAVVAMEARAATPEGREALDRVQRRVQALASLYRRLDGAPQADEIEVSDYLGGIVAGFRDSLAAGVAIEADLRPMVLPTRAAVPLGLVLNEMLTKAVKHAFAPGQPGTVRVSLNEAEGACHLTVEDDGAGMAEGAAGTGVGRALVAAFVAELGGEIASHSGPGGTRITVAFRP